MLSPITHEDLPSPKRLNVEETTRCEDCEINDCDSDEYDEAFDSFNEEIEKSEGFEMDFSKFKYTFGWKQADLDDDTLSLKPETNRELLVRLCREALSQRSVDQDKCLEVGEILRANYFLSSGLTFFVSFLVNDLSGNQTKPYRAVVQHHVTGKINVDSCNPKPA